MLTGLVGSILGFSGSVLPGIFDHLKRRQDNKQELAVMAVQATISADDNQTKIDMSVLALEQGSHEVATEADIKAGEREGQDSE